MKPTRRSSLETSRRPEERSKTNNSLQHPLVESYKRTVQAITQMPSMWETDKAESIIFVLRPFYFDENTNITFILITLTEAGREKQTSQKNNKKDYSVNPSVTTKNLDKTQHDIELYILSYPHTPTHFNFHTSGDCDTFCSTLFKLWPNLDLNPNKSWRKEDWTCLQ